jgi:hypothetical protein
MRFALMLEQEQGVIVAQPGFGKTNGSCIRIDVLDSGSHPRPHRRFLQQWISRTKELVPEATIGVIRGNEDFIGDITIATRSVVQAPHEP